MNAFRHPAVILLVLGGLAFAAVPTFETRLGTTRTISSRARR